MSSLRPAERSERREHRRLIFDLHRTSPIFLFVQKLFGRNRGLTLPIMMATSSVMKGRHPSLRRERIVLIRSPPFMRSGDLRHVWECFSRHTHPNYATALTAKQTLRSGKF